MYVILYFPLIFITQNLSKFSMLVSILLIRGQQQNAVKVVRSFLKLIRIFVLLAIKLYEEERILTRFQGQVT